jgi:hypothetical protein
MRHFVKLLAGVTAGVAIGLPALAQDVTLRVGPVAVARRARTHPYRSPVPPTAMPSRLGLS